MSLDACDVNVNPRQMELRPHGTADFPCGGYDTQIRSGEKGGVAWHWHEETEILYVTEGSVEVFLPDMRWTLSKGEGAFIHANVLHSILAAGEGGKIRSAVFHTRLISGGQDTVFQKKYIAPLLAYGGIKGLPLTGEEQWQKDMLAEIKEIVRFLEKKEEGYEWNVRDTLGRLWRNLYAHTKPVEGGNSRKTMDAQRLKSMLELIQKEYNEPLDLARIARAANIGERECLRCFHRTIGISPLQYLLRYRVSQAALLLRETNLPVAEVGMRCGFDSPSHFAQTFRKYFSITPSAYRKGKI